MSQVTYRSRHTLFERARRVVNPLLFQLYGFYPAGTRFQRSKEAGAVEVTFPEAPNVNMQRVLALALETPGAVGGRLRPNHTVRVRLKP